MRLRGAPARQGRHLLSSPYPLTSILTGVPWRSFTVSWPLQPGVGLLRRLRPPSRTLAFSRPTKVGQTVLEFPSSNAGADRVPEVPALRRVVSGTTCAGGRPTHQPPSHVWARCDNPFHLCVLTTFFPQVSLVTIGHRAGRSSAFGFAEAERLSASSRPNGLPSRCACCVALTPLSKRHFCEVISCAVKGRTSL